jgi:hypothetical protein
MKLLLTSAGIKNTSIHNALVELLGKPVSEASTLFIPTATYPFPRSAGMASDLRKSPKPPVRTGLEVLGSAGAHREGQTEESDHCLRRWDVMRYTIPKSLNR